MSHGVRLTRHVRCESIRVKVVVCHFAHRVTIAKGGGDVRIIDATTRDYINDSPLERYERCDLDH